MKTSEIIKILKKEGCYLERHGGRHDKWINPKTGNFQWLPRHSTEVSKGTAEKILKDLVGE